MVARIRKLAEVVRDDFPELTLVFRDNRRSLVTNEFDAAKCERFTRVVKGSLADHPEIAGLGEQFFHDDASNRSRNRIC